MTFVAARSRVKNAHHREAVSGTDFTPGNMQHIIDCEQPTEQGFVHLNFFIGAPGHQIQICKEV